MLGRSESEMAQAIEHLDAENESMSRRALGSSALRNFQFLMVEYERLFGKKYQLKRLKK